ncbi:MAG TPA: hypothetical protein VMB71_06755 [Acetobacteraceae bacterium]|nr:hypothetical protein [Acetobacteraceae bacterium]
MTETHENCGRATLSNAMAGREYACGRCDAGQTAGCAPNMALMDLPA